MLLSLFSMLSRMSGLSRVTASPSDPKFSPHREHPNSPNQSSNSMRESYDRRAKRKDNLQMLSRQTLQKTCEQGTSKGKRSLRLNLSSHRPHLIELDESIF